MEKQFQCTKIKDGLYIGNKIAAYDLEFLVVNKFEFVVNCAAEIANVYSEQGIKYLKFRLSNQKSMKVVDEDLKKLSKLLKFVQAAQEEGVCCLIHSNDGRNRSLLIGIAFLMMKFKWRLRKSLQYIKSKGIFIGLSEFNIAELYQLQSVLSKTEQLSYTWQPPFQTDQIELLTKTYLNSIEKLRKEEKDSKYVNTIKQKTEKRVLWFDKLKKQKKKANQAFKKQKKAFSEEKLQTKFQNQPERNSMEKQSQIFNVLKFEDFNKLQKQIKILNQKQLAKKLKHIEDPAFQLQQKQAQKAKIYKLTINNFINPKINLINQLQINKKPKSTKKQKIKRTNSAKNGIKKNINNEKDEIKSEKIKKSMASLNSTPFRERKERKSQKAVSRPAKMNQIA